ncbi:hypothetical protein FYJ34_12245 [Clostridiaceae bacterium 68-1-5]|uniref:Uncharacterized protein n=1 Tax=Suipraeoptans intestinalis TaxID=2606628 RepID=A0A6N7V4R3_9FIRM|nr:hypothetical protein [Suipraeoptans intestinalis]MSR94926.1 hypothetical protein [Suipraeoptans intestinalis]
MIPPVYVRQVREDGNVESVETYDRPVIQEEVIRGGVQIAKWDQETQKGKPQGAATLEGAVFEIVNQSDQTVKVNDIVYQPEKWYIQSRRIKMGLQLPLLISYRMEIM